MTPGRLRFLERAGRRGPCSCPRLPGKSFAGSVAMAIPLLLSFDRAKVDRLAIRKFFA